MRKADNTPKRRLIVPNLYPDVTIPPPGLFGFNPPANGPLPVTPQIDPLIDSRGVVMPTTPMQEDIGAPVTAMPIPAPQSPVQPGVAPVLDARPKPPNYAQYEDLPNYSGYSPGAAPTYSDANVKKTSKTALPIAAGLSLLSLFGGDAKGALPLFNAAYGGAVGGAEQAAQADYQRKAQAYAQQSQLSEKRYEADTKAANAHNDNIGYQNSILGRNYQAELDSFDKNQKLNQDAAQNATKESRLNKIGSLKQYAAILNNPKLSRSQQESIAKSIGELTDSEFQGALLDMPPAVAEKMRLIARGQDLTHDDKKADRELKYKMQGELRQSVERVAAAHDRNAAGIASDRNNVNLRIASLGKRGLKDENSQDFKTAKMFFSTADKIGHDLAVAKGRKASLVKSIGEIWKNTGLITADTPPKLTPEGEAQRQALQDEINSYDADLMEYERRHKEAVQDANKYLDLAQGKLRGAVTPNQRRAIEQEARAQSALQGFGAGEPNLGTNTGSITGSVTGPAPFPVVSTGALPPGINIPKPLPKFPNVRTGKKIRTRKLKSGVQVTIED